MQDFTVIKLLLQKFFAETINIKQR